MSGNLFVIFAPSGAGKTSLVKALIETTNDIQVSVSHTTRAQRPGEIDGVHYHFVDQSQFSQRLQESDFLEYAEVFGHSYGTSQSWVEQSLANGTDVVLEIDWQGAQQVRKLLPCISICILPPSVATLRSRLNARGQDGAEVIEHRMQAALSEISHYNEADYLIINDDFDTAKRELKSIVVAERKRTAIQSERHHKLLQSLFQAS
ncbi:MAG: guanylate kinase [Pseudomonadales bacterium]|nr:guanylate kinase [Pseudomonadales bacterium]